MTIREELLHLFKGLYLNIIEEVGAEVLSESHSFLNTFQVASVPCG